MLEQSTVPIDRENPTGTTLHTSRHGLSADESGGGELEGGGKLPDIVRLPVSVPTIRKAD